MFWYVRSCSESLPLFASCWLQVKIGFVILECSYVTTKIAVQFSLCRTTVNPWHQMPVSSWHPSSSRRRASRRTSSAAPRIDWTSDEAEMRTDVIGGGDGSSASELGCLSVRARVSVISCLQWIAGFLSTAMMA
jgi:hypothetical protein